VVQQFEVLLLATFVDGSQDVQQLTTNRRVAGEWDASELPGKVFRRSMGSKIQQMITKLSISIIVDSDVGVPLDADAAGWRDA